jgi:protein ImuB
MAGDGWYSPPMRRHSAQACPGMHVTKAQALMPGLIVHNADPAGDAEALDRLALWALRLYAPIAAADPPDGLVIDTTGAAHLHGGEHAMVEAMIGRLVASGFTACRSARGHLVRALYAFIASRWSRAVICRPADDARAVLPICPSQHFVCQGY